MYRPVIEVKGETIFVLQAMNTKLHKTVVLLERKDDLKLKYIVLVKFDFDKKTGEKPQYRNSLDKAITTYYELTTNQAMLQGIFDNLKTLPVPVEPVVFSEKEIKEIEDMKTPKEKVIEKLMKYEYEVIEIMSFHIGYMQFKKLDATDERSNLPVLYIDEDGDDCEVKEIIELLEQYNNFYEMQEGKKLRVS